MTFPAQSSSKRVFYSNIAAYALMGVFLLLVLMNGMLVALMSGFLMYCLITTIAPLLERKVKAHSAKLGIALALSTLIISVIVVGVWAAIHFFQSDAGSVGVLLQKLADIIETSRQQLPVWMSEHLPHSADELNAMVVGTLRAHAAEAQHLGSHIGHILMHAILGMLIGVMVALNDTSMANDEQPSPVTHKPLADALTKRMALLANAFQRIVFAQVKISAINSVITALFLFVALPLLGVDLPFKVTIVLVTFLGGLLPVAGNLIANTLLVVIALSHSLQAAIGALVFMMLVHKFEYFLNARIIGSSISAKAWELLTAMLIMETLFGIPGIVAAPILYAYVKSELLQESLV